LFQKRLFALACLTFFTALELPADAGASSDDPAGQGAVIIDRYLLATQSDAFASGKNNELEVEIEATVPRLNEHGHLRALRKISGVGKITYRVLGFQGDSTVKNQVIARYLQAEQQGQDDKSMTLTPANYKFKLKGRKLSGSGEDEYVFQVSPKRKQIGLFKGEIWLDARTSLPVLEKGRLVKNPSVFFRRIEFEREFAILNGYAVPARMSSVIDTRLVGKVNLSIAYTSPAASEAGEAEVDDAIANPIEK
jgi:hypothetical protein